MGRNTAIMSPVRGLQAEELMAKNKIVKVGIIGCGGFGNRHLDNLLKMDDVEVVALGNRGMERLERTGRKVPKARLYQDFGDMILKEKMDAAIISVTPDAHGEIEELCCRKNINLYIEKPLGISLEQAVRTEEEIKLSNIITSVGYQERYSPPIRLVKEILEKEPAGIVSGSWIDGMPSPQWWRTKSMSGGQAVEQTTHIADMMRYLFGEPVSVFASGTRDAKFAGADHDVEDHSSAIVRFGGGVTANILSGCYGRNIRKVGFEIFTPGYRIEYDWGTSLKISTGDRTEEIRITADNHFNALKTFIEAVRTGDRCEILSDYSDAVKTLKLTLMMNSSMEKNQMMVF